MQAEERFLQVLAEGIIFAGGTARFDTESAMALARQVWRELKEDGVGHYPSMGEQAELRFVYQWDQEPPVVTVMLWDDVMWRDMARIAVPAELVQ